MDRLDLANYINDIAKPVRYLMSIVPEDKLDWRPAETMMPLGKLLAHLALGAEVIGFTATENWPEKFCEQEYASMPPRPAIERFDRNIEKSIQAVKNLCERDYFTGTMKMPWGEEGKKNLMLMLMCDHIIHHKMQLFIYLKMLGFDLNSWHLYFGEDKKIE